MLRSATNVALADDWTEAAAFNAGPIDRLDVTVFNGDALMQVRTPAERWEPPTGLRLRKGLFRSLPGLTDAYPPGPMAVRFKRATVGTASVVDFEAWGVG